MDKATFSNRLCEASVASRDFAVRYVTNHLPGSYRYLVRLNQSFDGNPLKTGEQVFPVASNPVVPLSADAVADMLCRDDRVPEWIDISVDHADSEHTYFQLLCCGRFTRDEALLYYRDTGLAPFGCKSPALPPHWSEEQGRFDLYAQRA